MAQQSFENRAAKLQQSVTGEMKISSVEARWVWAVGRSAVVQVEAAESRRLAIRSKGKEVKGDMHGARSL